MIPERKALELIRVMGAFLPREMCGFILDDWQCPGVKNVASSDREFEMDADRTRYIYENFGDRITGVYHSHPGGLERPSQADINNAPDGLRYFIVTGDSITEWSIEHDESTATRSARMVDEVRLVTGKTGQTAVRSARAG